MPVPADAKKKQIMHAVEKLLATKRLHEITTDDVAEAAHVGKGTIYRHFQDKDDLFFETAAQGITDLCRLLDQKTDCPGDFRAHLTDICSAVQGFLDRRRQLFRALHSEEARAYWRRGNYRQRWGEHRQRLLASLERILQAGVQRGAVRSDLPIAALASVLMGLLRMGSRELKDVAAPAGPEWLADLFLRGAGMDGRGALTAPPLQAGPSTGAGAVAREGSGEFQG